MSVIVSDFVEIVGDSPVTIGDGLPLFETNFNTAGRFLGATAFLILNVRGLTYSTFNVEVKVNNNTVGSIFPYGGLSNADRDETAKHWYTQMIALGITDLKDGDNELQISAVKNPSPTAADTFDDFAVKNVYCFFHQAA